MVGHRNDDHSGLRRHGAKDLPRHVRGRSVRARRRADYSSTCSCHRLKFLDVLLTYTGKWVSNLKC